MSSHSRTIFEGRARFPRSKKFKDYRSLTYPQSGFKLADGRLHLSKIGKVRIFQHRPLEGTVRRLTIKYTVGEWYAILLTNRTEPPKPDINHVANDKVRGGDLGLTPFVTLDNAESVEYPKFLRVAEMKIKHLQRQLARKRKGSRRRRALARQLARLHLHVARQREDWQNKLVNAIFKEADVLVLEKLNVAGMLRNHHLAKAISDSSWSQIRVEVHAQSGHAGKHVLFIDPYGTSQFCHQCLTWVPKTLADREHRCPNCEVRPSQRFEFGVADQEAWHLKLLALGWRVVTRRAKTSTHANVKAWASSGIEARSPQPLGVGGRHVSPQEARHRVLFEADLT